MHNPEVVFNSLALRPGDYILDIGCGPGNYSIKASEIVGDSGMVYAIDRDRIMIKELETIAFEREILNINTIQADITKSLPVTDSSIDLCFISTVLHIPAVSKNIPALFNEVCRVLKPGKRLAIIECKKEEMPFGPPLDMRLSPTDIENFTQGYDFRKLSLVDLGYNYLIQFTFNPNG
ncbi:MAG: methyltransferase domain-containing protein [Desulfobacteraceae bacterium]|jgi:ubiquinone/menaquinone biosynthesis C-methylase UbiE